jgi:putative nucleotidyltransferase with HDIG domain/PAS domain S-box-containing protein
MPRVLVVEDEAVLVLDLRKCLDRLGYAVAGVATSGRLALAMVEELAPDLILMDIMLGDDMDGVEAARRIRERYALPVVFLTALSDTATLQRAGAVGPYGYVTKPFEDRDLRTALEIALYKHRMDRQLLEKERWVDITLNNLGEGLLTTDPSGRVRFVNPMAESLLGVDADAILGQALEAVYRTSSDASLPPCVNGFSGRGLAMLRCPDGRDIPVEQTLSPVLDDKGRRMGMVVVFRDVSHNLRVEQALRESVTQLRRTLEETVNALTVTSEKRDPFTAGHQERVSRLACAIASRLGLSEEDREGVRVAGLVHDIGKIHVPSEILAKPQALSAVEMGIVRDHCVVGHEILRDIPFPWPVARMVLEHHERLDGSGYPGGIKGGDTLLHSRILAVADVVEAMNAHRPYRAALGLEGALAEIRGRRGVLYDPDVADACLAIFEGNHFTF